MSVIIPGLYGLNANVAWQVFSKNPQKYIDKFAKDPTVTKEVAYFNKVAGNFKSVDDLLKDRRATQYLLNAYGLGSEINNLGRIKKILTEDPTADTSLSKKLSDSRFNAMASSLRLDQGMSKLQRETFREVIQDKYIQSQFEVNLGEQDASLRQAAYFARNAASGTVSSVYTVLGDSVLRDVIQTTFSIPKELAIQPVDSQATALSSRVDFSKFGASTTAATASSLTRAKSDFALLQTNLAVSDKAVAQMKALQAQLSQLVTDYTNLTSNTDPSGANATTIGLQQTAVPQLLQYQQELDKGINAIGGADTQIGYLNNILTQAKSPTADLADLKSQFSLYIASIKEQLDNASVVAPDGSTQNILENGSADTITITLDDTGKTLTLNRYDVSSLKNSLDMADASFNAVTDSSDTANLVAAQGRIYIAQDSVNSIKTTLASDKTTFDATVKAEPFYATLNTTALQKGADSVGDSLDRLTKVEDLISKIGDLAAQSAARDAGADRSDLESSFNNYRTQLRSLIENSGTAGLDNYLNNAPDGSYEILSGSNLHVKGGFDLANTVAGVLDAASLSDQASAQALQTAAINVTTSTDRARVSLKADQPYLNSAIGTYDPKGRLDKQIYDLKSGLDAFITAAASDDGKQNLLSAGQKDIVMNLSTTTVTLHAQPNFKSSFSSSLDSIISSLQSGDVSGALSALSDASYMVDKTQRSMSSENRNGTMEMGKLGGTIDMLTPKDTTDTENPYKMNTFTQKFLMRYLTQVSINDSSSGTVTGTGSYVLSLFSSSSGSSDSTSAMTNLFSLSMKV